MKYLFMLLFLVFGALAGLTLVGTASIESLLLGLISSLFLVGAAIIDAIDQVAKRVLD